MKFKKGDIVEAWWKGERAFIFQLHSDARFDYYPQPWGLLSTEKSWWASGKHIGGKYKGTYCYAFQLNRCQLHNSFGLRKRLKEFNFVNKK